MAAALVFVDLLPPAVALCGHGRVRVWGAIGYAAAVSSRVSARSMETAAPLRRTDLAVALAHPVSIAAYLALTVRSHRAHRRGATRWRGRPV